MMSAEEERRLNAWAASITLREQRANSYGTVTIHLENGVITRINCERSEKPEKLPLTVVKK
jgi:hypothetical protein